jgi:hypothetical protein
MTFGSIRTLKTSLRWRKLSSRVVARATIPLPLSVQQVSPAGDWSASAWKPDAATLLWRGNSAFAGGQVFEAGDAADLAVQR